MSNPNTNLKSFQIKHLISPINLVHTHFRSSQITILKLNNEIS